MIAGTPASRRAVRWVVIGALLFGALWRTATLPVTTRQGVDAQLRTSTLPLYVKALDFLHRHAHYRLLAGAITQDLHSDRERVLAIFEWTRRTIRQTPWDWPVVDDHVLHIVIRGHGTADQMADVFTTLATYAGLPAFWRQGPLVLSFVRVDGRWAVFDVANGLAFTDPSGAFIRAEELLREPTLAQAVAGPLAPSGRPYGWYVERLAPFTVPEPLRAELQMPWPRFLFELRRLWLGRAP